MSVGERSAVLLEQGRYRELLSALDGDVVSAEALVWAVRARMEQGYIQAATDLARNAPSAAFAAGEAGKTLELWRGFLALYDTGDHVFDDVAAEFGVLCRELTAGASASPWVAAVAADLQSRAEVLRFVLSGQGPQRRGLIVSGLAAVADGYRTAGSPREVAWTFRRAASFAADGPATGRSRARSLLVQACGEATAGELEVVRANLELMLAELDLRDLLDGAGGHDQKEVLARFDVLADSFRAGGHLFGDALVRWSVARWLLAYGLPDGLDMARAAAAGFAAADAPSSELQVWSALQAWYTAHGDPARGREARSRAARLVPGMGFPLAAETRVLDEANEAFRSGDVARARFLLTKKFWAAPNLQAASRLMLATSANAVGLRAEARQLLEGVIDDLTVAGASVLLGEALGLLSTMLTGEDDDRAAALLRQAAGAAQAAESPAEEAKYRAQLAWLIVTQRRSAQVTPFLSEEVVGEFEQAERLLADQRTLEAGGELVKLYQLRGQAAFLGSDWDQCGSWLTKAETTARGFGLLSDLAFILCYQGLALIEAGRRIGPSAYDQAAGRLEESQRLLRQAELPAFVWQTGFYRALCDIEAARWPQEAAERDARMSRASGLMEESSRLIDQLRESSDRGSADLGQRVRMAFSVDKQTFYSQGFHLVWDACSNADAAWLWLERMKGRALLDGLSDGDAPGIPLQAEPADATALETGKLAAVRKSEPPGYAEVRTMLKAEEAAAGRRIVVAEYLCTPERTLLFGARADWPGPRIEPVSLDHAALRRFAAATFRAPGGVRMMMQDRSDGGIGEWHRFAPLLEPLGAWSDPEDVVYLVPHGILHDVPLHTLPLDGAPLIERNPVCYVPAAAVLRHTLRGEAPVLFPTANESAAVFGDSRGDLAHARAEALAVAAMLGIKAVTGGDVTRERFFDTLRDAGVVHIAGHGRLSNADGFASGIDLAGTDVLRAGDLLGRRSSAWLVVLSGCETGVSEQRPGDEAVGFIRALLLSGVRSIVASQWRVSDASTQDLLCAFHQASREPSVSVADALRRAAREVRANPRYRHPYHWGSFALVGSWR